MLGKNLELSVQDSHDTTPANAVSAFRKLSLDGGIHYLIGPTWTVGGMPLAPLAARKKGLIMTSPSVGIRDFNETADNILNIWPHDEIATRKLAEYAILQDWKKAAIFGSEDPWVKTQSDTFEEEFTRRGGSITTRIESLPGTRELKSEALRVKKSNPDVVFFSNYQVDVFARELRNLKYSGEKLAILMEKERVKSADGALEDTVFALYDEPHKAFKDAFISRFKVDPGITADTAYDIVKLYAVAMEKAETTDVQKVLPELLAVKDYQGASGTFSINSKGAVDKKPVLWTVKGLDYIKVNSQ